MDIIKRVKELIMEQLDLKDSSVLTPEANFIEDLGADSLDIVEFIMKIEEEYGLEINDDEADKIATFGQLIAYLNWRLLPDKYPEPDFLIEKALRQSID